MESSKHKYRVVTTFDGLYVPQYQVGDEWLYSHTHGQSIEDCIIDIKRYIAQDDFVPQVVEISNDA